MSKNLFFIGLILAASGFVSPPLALACGLVFGLSFKTHPFESSAKQLSKLLLQISVVGLGFGMNLQEIVRVGKSGFVYTACSITFAMTLGWLLGRLFNVEKRISFLICAGTAICGGSAIAAVAPISGAEEEEIAVSLGTIFVLNSVALLTFPAIGYFLHMSQTQFGSVVGAGHSRHQFRGGRDREVRIAGPGRGHHREAGARTVDRAPFPGNGDRTQEQGAHPVAVVHSVLLPGGGGQQLPALLRARRIPSSSTWA